MIAEVDRGLWVGDERECRGTLAEMKWAAMLHACKDPCHRAAVGYTGRSAGAEHPEYLWAERGHHLLLNLVDAPVPIFRAESFTKALDFIDAHIGDGDVLAHCNQGLSRAPSIALLYLAKRRRLLPDASFAVAYKAFLERYPAYDPGLGLVTFLSEHWSAIH